MFKKSVSILLCIYLLCGFVTVASAKTSSKADKYQIIDILKHLDMLSGDYDDVTIEWTRPITKAEFAFHAANVLKRGYVGKQLYFHDVSRQHWAFSSIATLVETGLLDVNEEKMFYPNENISAEEAVGIVLKALGYKIGNGNTGIDLIKIANSIGVAKGISGKSELTFSDTFQLLYNTLITETMEMTSVSGGGFGYGGSGKIYLQSEYYMSYKEGILEGFDGISVSGKTVHDDMAVVSGVEYDVANVDLSDMLGCRIAYIYDYAKYDDDSGKIIWAQIVKSEDLTLYYAKNEVTFDTSSYKLSYYDEKGRIKSAKISRNADVIYNDEYITFGIESLLKGTAYSAFDGSAIDNMYSVKLIKNFGEDEYSKVILNSYQNIVVGAVDTENEGIFDKITKKYLALDGAERLKIYDKDGKVLSLSDLKMGDVLSVYRSLSGLRIKLYVSTAKASGKVTAQKSENGYEYITVDDTEYRGAEKGVCWSGSVNLPITLYLDVNGYIAYVERSTQQSGSLAYLIRVKHKKKDDKLELRMFKTDGSVTDCESSSVLRIEQDGVLTKYKNIGQAFDAVGGYAFMPSIISYKENGDGLITHIYFPSKNKNATLRQIYNNILDSDGKIIKEEKDFSSQGYSKISSEIGRFGNNTIIDNDTVMFGIPSEPKNADYSEFAMLSLGGIKIDKAYSFNKYALSDNVGCEEILVFNGYKDLHTHELLVTKMGRCVNGDDEVVDYVEGYDGNSLVTIKCAPSLSLASEGIQKGHYIEYAVNNNGDITGIEDKIRKEAKSGANLRASGWASGYANDIVDNIVKIGYKSGENSEALFYFNSSIPVLVFNTQTEEARVGSIADIKPYKSAGNRCSIVFTSLKNGVPLVYVVYE